MQMQMDLQPKGVRAVDRRCKLIMHAQPGHALALTDHILYVSPSGKIKEKKRQQRHEEISEPDARTPCGRTGRDDRRDVGYSGSGRR